VTINDIPTNRALAEETAAEITKVGRRSTVCIADVSVRADLDQLVSHHVKELGPLSVMVANAGIAAVKALLDTTEDEFKKIFDVNVVGVFNCYSAAAQQFIAQGTMGKLIGAASIVAFKPFPLLSPYSARKWA
jgi:NAD(P)-dependent dehydrogenase (short-subunit alcohol dehydrogenase family)